MILVFGGACQGKTDFVRERFNLGEPDIRNCAPGETALDTSARAIDSLNEFIMACVQSGLNPIAAIQDLLPELSEKIIVVEDVCCGLVPMGSDVRLYRDNVGKITQILARASGEVYRVFCGIGERIK